MAAPYTNAKGTNQALFYLLKGQNGVATGTVDPTASTGVAAPEGSIYLRYTLTSGQIWLKVGTANTAWVRLDIAALTTFSNANYAVLFSDKTVAQIGSMSAARTATLPAANSVTPGYGILIIDFSGSVTNTNKIIISRAGSDTINGLTTAEIWEAYGARYLISDGVSKWNFDRGVIRNGGIYVAPGTARVLNTTYQPSTEKWTTVYASININIGSGDDGLIQVLIDSFSPPTTVQLTGRLHGTITGLLATVNADFTTPFHFDVPPGFYYQIKTTVTAGSPTFTVVGTIKEIYK